MRTKGLTVTVILTLALGIGANAAIFTLVRGVLLRPLVNRDEDRLIYIRQSARGIGVDNAAFSVPEIQDLRARVKTLSAFGDFSTIGFTMVGLGEPREVRAGVVGGSYFDVMGLHPVLGRLLDMRDDGPSAAGAMVLTYRFWTTALKSDPSVLGKTVRLGARTATIVGVLEPSVPYPAETEIIANVVTSPHHLSATMVTGRVHRMTELFGRLAPGATLEQARAELRAVHGAILKEHPEAYSPKADFRIDAVRLRDQITSRARTVLLGAAGGLGAGLHHRVLERRQSDSRADGSARRRACHSRGARRKHGRAAPDAAGRKPPALRRGRGARRAERAAHGGDPGALRLALLGPRARSHGRFQHALGRSACWRWSPRCFWRLSRACRRPMPRTDSASRAAACGSPAAPAAGCGSSP